MARSRQASSARSEEPRLWKVFRDGATKGQPGSEKGTIVRDVEHSEGARITLERDTPTVPFAITCGIYGWMVHTRFLGSEVEALMAFEDMKDALARILAIIPDRHDPQMERKVEVVRTALNRFIEDYP